MRSFLLKSVRREHTTRWILHALKLYGCDILLHKLMVTQSESRHLFSPVSSLPVVHAPVVDVQRHVVQPEHPPKPTRVYKWKLRYVCCAHWQILVYRTDCCLNSLAASDGHTYIGVRQRHGPFLVVATHFVLFWVRWGSGSRGQWHLTAVFRHSRLELESDIFCIFRNIFTLSRKKFDWRCLLCGIRIRTVI